MEKCNIPGENLAETSLGSVVRSNQRLICYNVDSRKNYRLALFRRWYESGNNEITPRAAAKASYRISCKWFDNSADSPANPKYYPS